MPTIVCTAKASYRKAPGLLELTDSHLQWTPDGKKAPLVRVAYSEATCQFEWHLLFHFSPNCLRTALFCSKDNAPQVRLKLGLVGDDTGHNFTFTSPQPTAIVEREKFKKELSQIISQNRTSAALAPKTNPPTPTLSLPVSNAPTPKLPPSRLATSRAGSVASDRRAVTPVLTGNDPIGDFRLRKKVLVSDPELAALHRELVIGGQISEAEFWDGREHLLLGQAAFENQKKGKSGQLVDPRPETVEGGEIKIRITPQLVHDIFDEYPVVAKAYNDNVPDKLSEEEFWKRYFQSKLFNAHRASIRSSAAQHVVRDDPIFDQYLEKDDDGLEPRRPATGEVDIFVNLGATSEDHGETGNDKDITMQAGRQRGALPLIRKFNEHSEKLLNSALGEKRRKLDTKEYEYSLINLDDLRDPEASNGITLEMLDSQRYFEGRTNESAESTEKPDVSSMIMESKVNLHNWEPKLSQLKIERQAGDTALLSMTQNVAARLDIRTKKNDIPEAVFRQMTTCQTAANEFLRQFWLSTYPPTTDIQIVAVVTPSQRVAKAAKMIGYLSKTREKVEAIIRAAQAEGVDPNRVEVAMKPLLNAVDWALTFYHSRKGSHT